MSVSSVSGSFYASLVGRNKGIAGLGSGIDTEGIIEAMTRGTRNRIGRQEQKRQWLQWQQTAYRSTANVLRDWRNDAVRGGSGIQLNEFFNSYKASVNSSSTTASNAVKVTTTPDSQPGTININQVKQLATAKTYTNDNINVNLIGGAVDFSDEDFKGKTLSISVNGGSTRVIKLDSLNDAKFDGSGNALSGNNLKSSMEAELQKLINEQVGAGIVNVKLYDVNYTVNENDFQIQLDGGNNRVNVTSNSSALQLDAGQSNRVNVSQQIGKIFTHLQGTGGTKADTLVFKINGVEFTAKTTDTLQNVMNRINGSTAGVNLSYDSAADKIVLTATDTGVGDTLRVEDVSGNFLNQLLGVQGGSVLMTNGPAINMGYNDRINGNALTPGLDEENTGIGTFNDRRTNAEAMLDGMAGKKNSFDLTIDGVTKTITFDITQKNIDDIKYMELVKALESALPKNGIQDYAKSLNEDYNRMTAEDKRKFIEGNLGGLLAKIDDDGKLDDFYKDYDQGVDKNLKEHLLKQVNEAIRHDNAFGTTAKVNFFIGNQAEGHVMGFIINGNNKNVHFEVGPAAAGNNDFFNAVYDGASTPTMNAGSVAGAYTNYDSSKGITIQGLFKDDPPLDPASFTITVDGKKEIFQWTNDKNLHDLMKEMNDKFGNDFAIIRNGQLVINSQNLSPMKVEDDAASPANSIMARLFGFSPHDGFETATADKINMKEGQNAIVEVNGKEMTFNKNNIEVNGTRIQLLAETQPGEEITITITNDPTDVVDKIKKWVDDYNTMIRTLNALIREPKAKENGQYFAPLTEEQRAEMTKEEIDKWEEKAKQGLLYNDRTINDLMTKMRMTLIEQVEGVGLSLHDIGIQTKPYAKDNDVGTLEISEQGELRLRNAIQTNPDAVRLLFTDRSEDTLVGSNPPRTVPRGLAARLDAVIEDAVRRTGYDGSEKGPFPANAEFRGSLVLLGGLESNTGSSRLSRQIDNIDKTIARLKTRLESEYNRYWKRFSALETAISRMSTQSGWLADFSGQ